MPSRHIQGRNMTTITTCDECGQVVYNSRDERHYKSHTTGNDGRTICEECKNTPDCIYVDDPNNPSNYRPDLTADIHAKPGITIGYLLPKNNQCVDIQHPCDNMQPSNLELKTLELLALGELHKYTIGYFGDSKINKNCNVDINDLEDWVTIVAKNLEHAKKYYEVCFAKWRQVSGDPIIGGHKTDSIEWIGTTDNGYAVLPDDYSCDCKECTVSDNTNLLRLDEHPNLKVFYSNPNEIGLNYSIEKWDNDLECENCGKKGSYYMINEKEKIGACLEDIRKSTGDGMVFKRTMYTTQTDLDEDVHDGIMCAHCEKGELCDYQHCLLKHCDKCTEFKTPKREWLQYHCMNTLCQNFTSSHDLSGTWCQAECFIEFESGEPRQTREEYLQMIIDYGWYLDEDERREADRLGIQWSNRNRCP